MKETILIVDDHPLFRRSARMLLEAEGYAVVGEAEDGRSAVLEAEALAPDVVLLDVCLPGQNGFSVAFELTRRNLGIVVLTSSRDCQDFGTMVKASGAHGCIAKSELSGAALAAVVES